MALAPHYSVAEIELELANRIIAQREAAQREKKLRQDDLDLDGIVDRLNEAAVGAHLLGEFAQEVKILMHIAKLLKYTE